MRARTAAAALALVIATGCGDDEPSSDETPPPAASAELSGDERRLVAESERTIQRYCRKRALSLSDPAKRPSVEEQADALEAVDDLVALAADKPTAELRRGLDVRLHLGDLAENLEGANCDPQIVARIDQGLAELPARP